MTVRRSTSLPTDYFEAKYRADIDPWGFRTSPYEQQKYDATLQALAKEHYTNALEVGCSIGVFSALLALRCDQLSAVDGSSTAIHEAALQNLPNVRFEVASLPEGFPVGRYDLILLSEILYYFSEADLDNLAGKCINALEPNGEIVLCHWLGETNYPLTGQQATDLFANAVAKYEPGRVVLHEGVYRLERFCFPRTSANGLE